MPVDITESNLKQMLTDALAETLREQRELLQEVFADVFEELALAEAIREGRKSKPAARKEVFGILQGKS
jgi:hypothetical protein